VSWHLDDAELRAEQHEGFHVPPREERERLVVGDYAKLIFLLDTPVEHPERLPLTGERMWVEVTKSWDLTSHSENEEHLVYEGELNSTPVAVDISEKALVRFRPEHIIEIQRGDTLKTVFAREERDKLN
jgi:hypothetical protein